MRHSCLFLLLFVFFYSTEGSYAQNDEQCGYSRSLFTIDYLEWYQKAIQQIEYLHSLKRAQYKYDTVYRVPVIFHFIYPINKTLDVNEIAKKIQILTDDFRNRNSDSVKVRNIFKSRVGDAHIEFYLAQYDPDSIPTPGYTLKRSNKTFGTIPGADFSTQQKMKFDSTGGVNAWDTKHYLNIWVCDMTAPDQRNYVAGFATPPKNAPHWNPIFFADSAIDGIVLSYWGYNGTDRSTTLTHEVGHYFGLRHVSGDPPSVSTSNDSCIVDDSIWDTPRVLHQNYYVCDYSINSCIESIDDMPDMLENYMDYTGDGCRASYTKGQTALMRYCLTQLRPQLYTLQTGSKRYLGFSGLKFYPNPGNDIAYIEFGDTVIQGYSAEIFDINGKMVLKLNITETKQGIDISTLASSMYFIRITNSNGEEMLKEKLIKL